jgi:hypothetical protein
VSAVIEKLPLTDQSADLRPRPPLSVQEAGPAVPQVVGAEGRHGCGPGGAADQGSQLVGADAGEERVFVVEARRRTRRRGSS